MSSLVADILSLTTEDERGASLAQRVRGLRATATDLLTLVDEIVGDRDPAALISETEPKLRGIVQAVEAAGPVRKLRDLVRAIEDAAPVLMQVRHEAQAAVTPLHPHILLATVGNGPLRAASDLLGKLDAAGMPLHPEDVYWLREKDYKDDGTDEGPFWQSTLVFHLGRYAPQNRELRILVWAAAGWDKHHESWEFTLDTGSYKTHLCPKEDEKLISWLSKEPV